MVALTHHILFHRPLYRPYDLHIVDFCLGNSELDSNFIHVVLSRDDVALILSVSVSYYNIDDHLCWKLELYIKDGEYNIKNSYYITTKPKQPTTSLSADITSSWRNLF